MDDDLNDEGGILADMDFEDEMARQEEEARDTRRARARRERGRLFAITCKDRQGRTLYLQDKDKGGYWTRYYDNARTFSSEQEAKNVMENFHYNKPAVIAY